MRIRPILILSAALGVLPAAHAMQRCVDAQGHVSFSDRPCPSNTQSSAYEPKPAAGSGGTARRPGVYDGRIDGRAYAYASPEQRRARSAQLRADHKLAAVDQRIAAIERVMQRDSQEYAKHIDRAQDEFLRLSREGHHDRAVEAQARMKSLELDLIRRVRDQRERLSVLKVERAALQQER